MDYEPIDIHKLKLNFIKKNEWITEGTVTIKMDFSLQYKKLLNAWEQAEIIIINGEKFRVLRIKNIISPSGIAETEFFVRTA